MSVEIIWLRQDLRLADNPLFHSVRPSGQLLCVYVLDQSWLTPLIGEEPLPRIGPARLHFLWYSLIELRGQLLKLGSDLLVRIGNPVDVITEIAFQLEASRVTVRQDAGFDETQAVVELARRLKGQAEVCEVQGGMLFNDACLPVRAEDLPTTFSAFRRRAERDWRVPNPLASPMTLPPWPRGAPRGLPPLDSICPQAARFNPDPRGGFRFRGGEQAGLHRLDRYLWHSRSLGHYKQTRNRLHGNDFSTRFSPWLAQGCLSARHIHEAVREWEKEYGVCESSYWVIFELLWREYFHWAARQEGPDLYGKRLLPGTSANFHAWCRGQTGMPFIDAAMQELASTGWLSNRARQNAASFLVRDLNVDWRLGASWFEHCLIDHDVASNWGNWRYVAGVGRDARQRSFDVQKQAEHYDPDGAYVALWRGPALPTHLEEP
jgi:deoxyribodipyrimidine photo-lyase